MARLFTLEEAENLLPELRAILEDLRRAVEVLDGAGSELAALEARIRRNGRSAPEDPQERQRAARDEVRRLVERVQALGVELKDPRSGLVDFPSRREGQTVYLCWQLGEPSIAWWHPIETGFAGRQPL